MSTEACASIAVDQTSPAEAPKVETPKVEAPKVEPHKSEAAKADIKSDISLTSRPRSQA